MQVKDLQPRQGNVEVVIEVTEKGNVREFDKFGKKGKVCSAKAKDASGEIILSLWNDQVDQVSVGDTVKVMNGYVNEYQGEKQLTTGKFGKLEIVSKSSSEASEEKPKVYTNAPPNTFKGEMKTMKALDEDGDPLEAAEELSGGEELSEEPVNDEEYIG